MADRSPAPLPILTCGLQDARRVVAASLATGIPVILVSPRGGAGSLGGGWWVALIEALEAEFPCGVPLAVLDCADAPGRALGALRAGVRDLALEGPADVLTQVEAIARAYGARLHAPCPAALDVRPWRDAAAALRRWWADATSFQQG